MTNESEYLLRYEDEINYTEQGEASFIEEKEKSECEALLVALLDGKIVGMIGLDIVSPFIKTRHRASIGMLVEKDNWGRGIGKALLTSAIDIAKRSSYKTLELEVVKDNERAIRLYEKMGFVPCGRKLYGQRLRNGEYQELVEMYLLLE